MQYLLDLFFPPRADELVVRRETSGALSELLSPKLAEATRPGTTALLPFTHERVRPILHEAKYHGNHKALDLLADVLGEFLQDAELDFARTCIVPVPLGTKRHRERGYNQSEEIARRAAQRLGIRMESDLLVRARETLSQIALKRHERELNLLGAFFARRDVDPSLTYIVFDDVLTTGATLQAAIDAVAEAGAEHILPIALAH